MYSQWPVRMYSQREVQGTLLSIIFSSPELSKIFNYYFETKDKHIQQDLVFLIFQTKTFATLQRAFFALRNHQKGKT